MEIPVGVWGHYGFLSSPYSTSALRVADADESLLVGREAELKTVLRDLMSGVQVVALEGDYGVGKSSLAAVATSNASRWRTSPKSGYPLFLAPGKPLELEEKDSAATFERRTYFQVAGAILSNEQRLLRDGYRLPQLAEFKKWLSSATGGSWSAGINASFPQLFGAGISAGHSKTANTSAGFTEAGAVTLIDAWLAELFPSPDSGGVILLLDNLEVLAQFPKGIQLFESLRDRLFKRQGLRWIISGAEGTVRLALSTPKMSGVFPDPVTVTPLPHELVGQVIARRKESLRSRGDAKLPVSPAAFEAAYTVTGRNLRFTLGLAERFSMRTDPGDMAWKSDEERDALFAQWVHSEGEKAFAKTSSKVTDTEWKLLTALVTELDGFATTASFEAIAFRSASSLQPLLDSLASSALVTMSSGEDDTRKRVITATEKARLAVSFTTPAATRTLTATEPVVEERPA